MPELNVDVPVMPVLLREEFLYDGDEEHAGNFRDCYLVSATSIPGRALGFQVLLDDGALIDRLPIHALCHKKDAPRIPLHFLQLWDCFSVHCTVNEHDALHPLRCEVLLRDKTWHEGIYEWTIDWYGNRISEDPGEGGHKSGNFIRLNNGNFALQPNNRIRWHEPSFVTRPFPERPDYRTNTRIWTCENQGPKWATLPDDRQFYDERIVPPPSGD